MVIYFARVHDAAFAHEFQQELCPLRARRGPGQAAFGGDAAIGARMHQRLKSSGHETVVDEEILIDAELHVAAFEVAGTVILHAMAQDQVLRAGGSADRIGLHKAQPMEGALQRGWREEAPGDRKAPQLVDGDRHSEMLFELQGLRKSPLGNRSAGLSSVRLRDLRGEGS